jgi:L-malate glycosyltransferase
VSIIRKRNPQVHAVIVGIGPEKDRLEKKATSMDLRLSVQFLGSQPYERVIGLMKSSKVFVFPSTREGFGIAVLEANACGLPVVTVNHKKNAAKDLIQEGENGYVVPLSATDLAEAASKIIQDEKLRKTMSAKSIRYAEGYDWEIVAGKLLEEYFKITPTK